MIGSSGLGLYALAQRVTVLGGYYGCGRRRDGDRGSAFWFSIPYTPDLFTSQGGLSVDLSSPYYITDPVAIIHQLYRQTLLNLT